MRDEIEDEISSLRRKVSELESRVYDLETIQCGFCGKKVMRGKKVNDEGQEISLRELQEENPRRLLEDSGILYVTIAQK